MLPDMTAGRMYMNRTIITSVPFTSAIRVITCWIRDSQSYTVAEDNGWAYHPFVLQSHDLSYLEKK